MSVFRLLILFFLIGSCAHLIAQNGQNKYDLDINDIYVLKVVFERELYSDRCDCCSSIGSKHCVLVQGKITEVLAMGDTSVFKSATALEQVQFFLSEYPMEIDSLTGELLLSCSNTCTSSVIKVNHVLPSTAIDFNLTQFYIGGLSICYDFNWIQRFQLRFGIRRKKIYEKASVKKPETSKFIKFLIDNGLY